MQTSNFPWLAMMVNLSVSSLLRESIAVWRITWQIVRVEKTFDKVYLKEWNHKIADEPNIHHLDVRCLGQSLGDRDEHGGQNLKMDK